MTVLELCRWAVDNGHAHIATIEVRPEEARPPTRACLHLENGIVGARAVAARVEEGGGTFPGGRLGRALIVGAPTTRALDCDLHGTRVVLFWHDPMETPKPKKAEPALPPVEV